MSSQKQSRLTWLIMGAIILLGLGILLGGFVEYRHEHPTQYSLLDPSVVNPKVHQENINFDPLRQSVKQYLKGLKTSHSFYFEYLPNGVNIRDGEDNASVAASLLKTPVVMDLYKVAELGKVNLEDTTTIQQGDISNDFDYGDPSGLTAGQTISLRNAARLALHDSDNTAIQIIKRVISPYVSDKNDVFQNLDLPYKTSSSNPTDQILSVSARSYSSILKCLYYSCYLTPKSSEEILSDLIDSRNLNRIIAGVDKYIKVAHKIGSGIQAQSDCGIVYVPNKPYLICLMFFDYKNIQGNETDAYFKKVSKMAYDYVVKS